MTASVHPAALSEETSSLARLRASMSVLLKSAVPATVPAGMRIFTEGEELDAIFALERGVVKLSRKCRRGEDCIIGLTTKNDFLGIRDTMRGERFSSTATAIVPVEVLRIERSNFEDVLRADPAIQLLIFSVLSRKVDDVETTLVGMSTRTARQRVAWALLMLREALRRENPGNEPHIDMHDVSALSTCADGTLVKLLREFDKRGLLHRDEQGILLLNPVGLRRVIGEF